jgi:hypothetical protein
MQRHPYRYSHRHEVFVILAMTSMVRLETENNGFSILLPPRLINFHHSDMAIGIAQLLDFPD